MITATRLSEGEFQPPKTIAQLREYLQAALEVEHLTIPVYMTGMYTIRPGTNRDAHFAIRSVLLEEMLHMTLAANLLNAVGGKPELAHPKFLAHYPAKLPFSSGSLPLIGLQHFSPAALQTFLLIERPQFFVPPTQESGWTSIGQFYAAVRQGLLDLVEQAGGDETKVFTGDPAFQVGPADFYNSGGEAFAITDLKSALLALRVISEQGEGLDTSLWDSDDQIFGEVRQPAHYFRFNEIYLGRRYSRYDLPRTPPSGPLLNVTWDDTYKIDGATKIADYPADSEVRKQAETFNQHYATMLSYLHLAFNGKPAAVAGTIPAMLALRDLSERLYRNPHPDPQQAKKGIHASATFELKQQHFDAVRDHVAATVEAAGLDSGEPVDLSPLAADALTPCPQEQLS